MQNDISWDKLRKRLKTAKPKPKHKCRKCVWADTSSGFILCTRYKCVKKTGYDVKR